MVRRAHATGTVDTTGSIRDNPDSLTRHHLSAPVDGLGTAVLFEAGAKSLAIAMMGSPKAARRASVPAEFVVYPETGHNIRIPGLQKESAKRNLDWFRFRLKGEEDANPTKADQYTLAKNAR